MPAGSPAVIAMRGSDIARPARLRSGPTLSSSKGRLKPSRSASADAALRSLRPSVAAAAAAAAAAPTRPAPARIVAAALAAAAAVLDALRIGQLVAQAALQPAAQARQLRRVQAE